MDTLHGGGQRNQRAATTTDGNTRKEKQAETAKQQEAEQVRLDARAEACWLDSQCSSGHGTTLRPGSLAQERFTQSCSLSASTEHWQCGPCTQVIRGRVPCQCPPWRWVVLWGPVELRTTEQIVGEASNEISGQQVPGNVSPPFFRGFVVSRHNQRAVCCYVCVCAVSDVERPGQSEFRKCRSALKH